MSEPQLERSVLEAKDREELYAIADALGTKPGSRARKADLIGLILRATGIEGQGDVAEPVDKPRRTRARKAPNVTAGAPEATQATNQPVETASTGRSRANGKVGAPNPTRTPGLDLAWPSANDSAGDASAEPAAEAARAAEAAHAAGPAADAGHGAQPAADAANSANSGHAAQPAADAANAADAGHAAQPAADAANAAHDSSSHTVAALDAVVALDGGAGGDVTDSSAHDPSLDAVVALATVEAREASHAREAHMAASTAGRSSSEADAISTGGVLPGEAAQAADAAQSADAAQTRDAASTREAASTSVPPVTGDAARAGGPTAPPAEHGTNGSQAAEVLSGGDGQVGTGSGSGPDSQSIPGPNHQGMQGPNHQGAPAHPVAGQRDHAGQARVEAEPGNRRNRRRRGRERGERPERTERTERSERDLPGQGNDQQFAGEPVPVKGFLDLKDEGYGFLRTKGFLPGPNDVYVSISQARRFALRKGDEVQGASRPAATNEKYPALLRLDTVNGLTPDEARQRPKFEDLTPLFPDEKMRLEVPGDAANMTARIVDLISPIGKGQRGLIVSPPKAGKTTVLKQIAHSIEANNPEVHLMVLLVDERPEEVTDMRRSVKGEVIASTFDRPSDEHTQVAELAIERAKRLVEMGRDVVIVLDGITRLARAYNLAQPATGRIMSGGIDTGALYPPKKFFGSARNIEEGGSLTILATALVETGSRMDEVIFEEFKGTGNMELRLDRRLAERRIYPALDVNASSTRHEELLFDRTQLQQVWKLRRVLNALGSEGSDAAGLQLLMDKIKTTRSNDEFLAEIAKTPTPAI